MNSPKENFRLTKWFLDFTNDEGEAMIFYSAEMRWHKWTARYTSWLNYSPLLGTKTQWRFTSVSMPALNGNSITWSDSKFGVSGTWKCLIEPVKARLFDSDEGFLDWNCYQPKSEVTLNIDNQCQQGRGYAELLILTALPWKIPMDELRWGRFVSEQNSLVWIEIREKQKQQWLWLNSNPIEESGIHDDQVTNHLGQLTLNLDLNTTLESEKKISWITGKLIRFIPGFKRVMPVKFLMADETKWLSHGILQIGGREPDKGMVIHEFVNFNPQER